MSGDHAFLAPSSAHIWGPGGCPAHPRMVAAYPEDGDTLAAREGTAAHHYVTETAAGASVPVGSLAPNGHPITEEMVECGADMVTDMVSVIARGIPFAIEQRVSMPGIHPTLNWGQGDFVACDHENRVLYAWDYKFGHRPVDAFENQQLVEYGEGAANHFGVSITPEWTLDLRIYQPRAFHGGNGPVQDWMVDGARFSRAVAALATAAKEAADPDAPMRTGDHCGDCSARFACPAFRQVAGYAVDVSQRGVPHVLEPANAGLALRMVRTARERLEDMETGLEAQIMATVRAGDMSTGWETYQSEGREVWIAPVDEVVALGDLLGKDLRKPPAAITPAQARKKGIDDTVISVYAKRPMGEVKLRPIDSKDIRKAFQ